MDSKRPTMGEKSSRDQNKSKQKVNRRNEKDVHRTEVQVDRILIRKV